MEASRRSLLLALGAAAFAALLGWSYLSAKERELLRKGRMLKVVAASHYLSAYSRLKARDLARVEIPAAYVPLGTITEPKDAVGQLLLVAFNAGEPLSFNKLAMEGAGLSYSVPEGYRAFTIPVDKVTGLAGLLRPGDLVDMIYLDEPGKQGASASLLAQGAQVLAAGQLLAQGAKADAETSGSVTLALAPEDCLLAMMALNRGALQLALRPVGDGRMLPLQGLGPGDLAARIRRRLPLYSEP
jgi:pilus assembly protein CpaB